MKKWYCLITVIMFSACQKGIDWGLDVNPGGTANSITGTWKFVSITANTQYTSAYTQSDTNYKTITNSNYTSINNTGTITFNADSTCVSSGVGYDISDTAVGYNYQNGVLVDSSALPFSFSVDSSSSTARYALIGSDSIAHSSGFIPVSTNTTTQSLTSGGKYNISGNTLTLTELYTKDTAIVISGVSNATTESGKFIITLQKQ